MTLSFITWSVSPEIFQLGPFSIRWYGLLFALAFIVGYRIMLWMYRREKKAETDVDQLTVYMILGTVIGARLGHCLFYDPEYYLSNPLQILMIWKGGLASHGAAVGILIAIYLYVRKKKESYVEQLDRLVVVAAPGFCFIRLGNLFNSEIIGKPADVAWAFIFTSVDNVPRHPAQLYESIAYLIIFFILLYVYKNKMKNYGKGLLLGLSLVLIFSFRFFVEFLKEDQSAFEKGMALNMGQILSIPFVIAGIVLLIIAFRNKPGKLRNIAVN